MPRNASGVYTLPAGNPVVPGTTIDAAWANDTLEDLANEVTNSLSRTGAGGMLAPFRLADGTITAPGIAWLNETNSGLYRSGAGSTWMSILGVNTAQFSTVGLTIPFGKSLTAQGSASVVGTFSVGGPVTFSSTLALTGALTASGGVVGNVTGNVTAGSGTSTFNDVVITGSLDMTAGSSATITGLSTPTNASDAANKGYVDAQVATRLPLSGGTMTGGVNMNNNTVTGLPTPSLDADAANKAYVDSVAQGIDAKASCKVASIGNMTLSNTQIYDGVALSVGDRVLVKDQTDSARNGIYVVASGNWQRAADANTWDELLAAYTFIEQGTNANNGYICTISPGGTLNTTPVTWAQFSGAGQIDAGAGLIKTGNTLAVGTASSSRIVVNSDNIDLATTGISAGTYRSLTVDAYGRATAGTNPTTLAGYGITDAYTTAQVDSALALKLNLSGGTMSGAIAMGANKITNLADPTNPQDAATKTYIDTIFGSTASAAASATAAANSASAAATSATNAANSATAAAGSATSAANTYTTFNNQYLGSKASDPTVNNTGGALVAGNLYWNSTVNEMRVYTGSSWLAAYIPATGYLQLTGGTLTGNLGFNGTGLKITGDLSNATIASRLAIQSSTANGNTGVVAIPNGTATTATWRAYNAADPDNASVAILGAFGATDVRVSSDITGTGTYLPMTFHAGGSERGRVTTGGNWLLGTSTDNATDRLQVSGSMSLSSALRVGASPSAGTSGQVLTSAGAGAAPTWTTLASSQWTTSGSNISYTAGQVQIGTGTAAAPALSVAGDTNTGIFFPAADTIAFAEGGTESMRLDSSGNLGLGVTPGAWTTYRAFDIGGGQSVATYQDGATNTIGFVANALWNGSWVYRQSSVGASRYALINNSHAWYIAPSGTAGNAATFTQAMTLDASGNLLINSTNSGSLPGNGYVFITNPSTLYIGHAGGTASGTGYLQFWLGGGAIGSISQNGSSAVSYNTSSDYRLKEDIAPMTGALAKVAALKPVTYKWKVDGSDGEGFIAHELAEVCPHAVTGEKDGTRIEQYEISPAVPATYDEDGNELTPAVEAVMGEREVPVYQGIDTSFLVATLTAAIQEQQAMIAQLTERVAALEAKQETL